MQTAHDSIEEDLAENMRGHMYNSAPLRMDGVQDSSWCVVTSGGQGGDATRLYCYCPRVCKVRHVPITYVVNRLAFCRIHTEGLT